MEIKQLHLDITNDCNLKCGYCCFANQKESLGVNKNVDYIMKAIFDAREIGVKDFSISGGEPLLHPNFLDILIACGFENKVVLFSNLYNASEEKLEKIAANGNIKELIISIDGFNGHDQARPPSKHADIFDKLMFFKQIFPNCMLTVNTIVTKFNLKELKNLYIYLADIGVNNMRIDMPMKNSNVEIYCNFEDIIKEAAHIIETRYLLSKLQSIELTMFKVYKSILENIEVKNFEHCLSGDAHPCEYRLGHIAVNELGQISICTPLNKELGKIDNTKHLKETINDLTRHKFFKLAQNDIKECTFCRYFKLCGTGCRGDAYRWTGDDRKPDPIACSLMPLVEKYIIPILSTKLKDIYISLIGTAGSYPKYNFRNQKEIVEPHIF